MKLCAVAVLFFGFVAIASAGLAGRVIGGTRAPDGAYPYQAFIKINGDFGCGASIINKHWLLTAGHCVQGLDLTTEDTSVVVGTNDRYSGGDNYKVESYVKHPKFGYPRVNPINDIALLRVAEEIKFNEKVKPIALPTNKLESYEDKVATLTGWGTVKLGGENPQNLQQINVTVYNQKECRKIWFFSRQVDVIESNICTFTKRGEGVCHGDSGGPLVVAGTQVGVVSYGWPCAKGYPDVFTRVSSFLDWINEHVTS